MPQPLVGLHLSCHDFRRRGRDVEKPDIRSWLDAKLWHRRAREIKRARALLW